MDRVRTLRDRSPSLLQQNLAILFQPWSYDGIYFDAHPDEDEYIREFVPGEFGKAELTNVSKKTLAAKFSW